MKHQALLEKEAQEALEHISHTVTPDHPMIAPMAEALAEMFEKQEEWERAMEVYALGLARAEDARLHNGLGYCLGKLGRLKEAEHHNRRTTELEPASAAYANDLGYDLLEQGMFQEARALFERALQLDPSYELARGNLRLCSEEASQSM